MKTERFVWFGYTGTLTLAIFRLTVFFVPRVVVVFLTTSVTWTYPHSWAWTCWPLTVFVTTTTFFFGVAWSTAVSSAAAASATGIASAAAQAATIMALRMSVGSSLRVRSVRRGCDCA